MGGTADLIDHYGGGDLLAAIEAGLAATGRSTDSVTVADLGPVDEFHIGGRPATAELAEQLDVATGCRLLDVGCGIGGASRFFASTTGCSVVGIDLSPTYVEVATELTRWTGLDDQVRFEAGSALALPFDDNSFDRAVQLHVGMNIAEKAALFTEVARVLRPGGIFAVYDIVRTADGEIAFPMPWASNPDQSAVATAEDYTTALTGAGFSVTSRDRHRFALDFFAAQASQNAKGAGPPPLGLHLIIGNDAAVKLGNLRAAVTDGDLAPYEFVGRLD